MDIGRTRPQLFRTSPQPSARRPLLPPRNRNLLPFTNSGTPDSTCSSTTGAPHTSTYTAGSAYHAGNAPFGSLSRIFISLQPTQLFRTLAERSAMPGPAKLLLFLVAVLAAIAAVTRVMLTKKVKACKCCRGYGISRCQVCEGMGQVQWNAKFGHTTSCPLCFNRRYIPCQECGGSFPRPMFAHCEGGKPLSTSFSGPLRAGYGLGS